MSRTRVVLTLCGSLFACESLAPEPSPASVPARVVGAPRLPPQVIDPAVMAAAVRGGVRQRSVNEGVFEVDAFLAALVVEDLRSARPSVTLEPVVENELQIGYRISGIRDGSIYGAVGLLDGDVIESINGVVLAGPDQVAGAIVASERMAALQVTRAGVSAVHELRVAPGLAWSTLIAARSGALPPADLAPGTGAVEPPIGEATAPPTEPVEVPPRVSYTPSGQRIDPPAQAKPAQGKPAQGKPAQTRPSTPATTPASTPASNTGITCAGDGSCTVTRREFDAAVADPERLTRQVQLGEAPGGYRLSGIRSGTQVSQLGFRNGDIIKSINGTSVDNQMGLLALYAGLGSASSYRVGFVRGGSSQSKTIRIR